MEIKSEQGEKGVGDSPTRRQKIIISLKNSNSNSSGMVFDNRKHF